MSINCREYVQYIYRFFFVKKKKVPGGKGGRRKGDWEKSGVRGGARSNFTLSQCRPFAKSPTYVCMYVVNRTQTPGEGDTVPLMASSDNNFWYVHNRGGGFFFNGQPLS